MKTYKVNIIEHGELQVEVEAKDEREAEEKARTLYENGDVLMAGSGANDDLDFLIDRTEVPPKDGCPICGEAFCQDSHTSVNKHGW